MSINTSLTPVSAEARRLDFSDFAALWGSLGVGLLVMLAGASLLPALSPLQAFGAIAAGTGIGAVLLGLVGRLGAITGLSSAGLIRSSLGANVSFVALVLNVLQLIGWALFEVLIMRDGAMQIARGAGFEISRGAMSLVVAAILAGLLALSMTGFVRKFIRGIGISLMGVALVWLTYQLVLKANGQGWDAVLGKSGDGSMSFAAAVDLVIAMPISWLPLIADYTRFGRAPGRAFAGSALGYGLANAWCFGLGVLLALLNGNDLIAGIALLPFGLGALGLILIDEMDNAYSDLYSAAVSSHAMVPQLAVRLIGPLLAGLVLALGFYADVESFADYQTRYQNFLFLIGAVFVPLFGVVLARWADVSKGAQQGIVWPGLIAWLVGLFAYEALSGFSSLHELTGFNAPEILKPIADFGGVRGASLPTLIISFCLCRGLGLVKRD